MSPPPPAEPSPPRRIISIRAGLLLAFALVVLLVSGSLLTASLLGTARLARDVAGSLMFGLERDADVRLRHLFNPIERKLVEDYAAIREGRYSARDAETLKALLLPVLFSLPQVDSMMVVDPTDGHLLLMRYSESVRRAGFFLPMADRLPPPDPARMQVLTRDYRPAEKVGKSHFAVWDDAGRKLMQEWDQPLAHYDGRQRPWYKAAMASFRDLPLPEAQAAGTSLVAWTEVYQLFITKDPGISAAVAARDPAGDILIVTYNLPLDDIARFTTSVQPSPRGMMFVMTDDEKLLGPPRISRAEDKAGVTAPALLPIAEAGFPSVAKAVAKWQADRGGRPDRFRLTLDGETWWAGFSPFEIGSGHRLWIGVLLPESDLIPAARQYQWLIAGVGLLALAAAAWLALRLARWFSEPLTELAAQSRRIASLDLAETTPVRSHLAELALLSTTLGRMRASLREHIVQGEQSRRELAARGALLRTIIETEPECIHSLSLDGRILEMNRAGVAMLEAESVAQLQGRPALEFVAPEYQAAYRELHERVLRGDSGELEFECIGLKGGRRWVEMHAAPLRDAAGGVMALLGIARDITLRKQAQAGLLLQSAALAAAANAIVITDSAGRVEWANPAFTASSGFTLAEAVGQNLQELVHSGRHDTAFFQSMWDTILAGRVWRGETVNRRKDGSLYTEDTTITPVRGASGAITHFIGIKQDITQQRKLEEQVRHAQRMEAVGTLASGIAHDLNNILAPMPMVVALLLDKLSSPRDRDMLKLVESGAVRGADVIRQLLTFSRGAEGERTLVQFRYLIKEMENIMRETFPREITITAQAPAELWRVRANATQMHQILMNLCVNARDAMPGGGRLELAARNLVLPEGDPRLEPQAQPGPYVEVVVSDTGHGIAPDIIPRIFDPFFTTKGVGKGTGLGLSTTLGIVRSHGGFIRTESVLKQGAKFSVYLPAEVTAEPPPPSPEGGERPGGHGELILLVDDEASIREAAQQILEQNHYEVLTAVNGENALALYFQHRGEVRLVLTDVMMPVKGGAALIRSLRAMDPELKVVATSGLGQVLQGEELAKLGIKSVLPKPFAAGQLLDVIHQQLSSPA